MNLKMYRTRQKSSNQPANPYTEKQYLHPFHTEAPRVSSRTKHTADYSKTAKPPLPSA